jgi:hypothetical protein
MFYFCIDKLNTVRDIYYDIAFDLYEKTFGSVTQTLHSAKRIRIHEADHIYECPALMNKHGRRLWILFEGVQVYPNKKCFKKNVP